MVLNPTFIINPAAGFYKTNRNLRKIKREIESRFKNANMQVTRHRMHATALTKEALHNNSDRIIVIGGDGTLNEVVNGFFEKDHTLINKDASLAMVPSGSGSDFVKSFGKQYSFGEYLDIALNKKAKPTDVGYVIAHDARGQKVERYFINISSFGLSGLVAGMMDKTTRKFGSTSAYFMATARAVKEFKACDIIMETKEGKKRYKKCSLMSFANGKFYGSGMQIAPFAKLDDGLFDVVTITKLNLLFFLRHGLKVYKGEHLHLENIDSKRLSECTVSPLGEQPVFIETDGELFAKLPARYKNYKHALNIVR